MCKQNFRGIWRSFYTQSEQEAFFNQAEVIDQLVALGLQTSWIWSTNQTGLENSKVLWSSELWSNMLCRAAGQVADGMAVGVRLGVVFMQWIAFYSFPLSDNCFSRLLLADAAHIDEMFFRFLLSVRLIGINTSLMIYPFSPDHLTWYLWGHASHQRQFVVDFF